MVEYEYDSVRFGEVWRRVMNQAEETPSVLQSKEVPPPSDTQDILACINDTAFAIFLYRQMTMQGRYAATFRRLAEEKEQYLRRLQAEYFLLTGDTAAIAAQRPQKSMSRLEWLRMRCFQETEAVTTCTAAAERTAVKERYQLFRDLADNARDSAVALRGIIQDIIR